MRTRVRLIGTTCLGLLFSLGIGQRAAQAPTFQVDPLWPKPLPNHWILGSITGVALDGRGHIWIVQRGIDSFTARTEIGLATDPPTAEVCCRPAPQVLEFDAAGALVSHWGGPGDGYQWPRAPGGIAVDAAGNVWIAGAGLDPPSGRGRGRGGRAGAPAAAPPPQDAHVLKFSRTGSFVRQIGRAGELGDPSSTTALNRPTDVAVDGNELYVADTGNRRIVVFDAETGAYKRHWGAYGGKPDGSDPGAYDPDAPAAKQFRNVSCVSLARDGQVYVCDRTSDRIQVFKKDGTFVKEAFVSKTTRGLGSVWDVAFSPDPQQRFLYVADGQDQKVWVLQRDTLEVVSSVGAGGRWPGHFFAVGSVVVDAQGNLYTGEALEGKRLQKFIPKGR
jgi:DNA-binding beta-propeller fold protein YncE